MKNEDPEDREETVEIFAELQEILDELNSLGDFEEDYFDEDFDEDFEVVVPDDC